MKKHFLFEVKARAKKAPVFKKGMPPGVFASHIATFEGTESELTGSMFIGSLLQHSDGFLKDHVEVVMTECDEEGSPLNEEIEGRDGRKADGKGSG